MAAAYHPKYQDGDYEARIDFVANYNMQNFWYLEDIYVQPKYRGGNMGLIATAIFLAQYTTTGDLIATHPYPTEDYRDKYENNIEKGIKDMLKYLAPLDFEGYSPVANLLWTTLFLEPDFLARFLENPWVDLD